MIPSVWQLRFAVSITSDLTTCPHDKLVLTGVASSEEPAESAEVELELDFVGVLLLLVGRALFKIFSIMLLCADAKVGCVNKAPTDANANIAAMRYILLFIRTN
jgi:hypothetical protein